MVGSASWAKDFCTWLIESMAPSDTVVIRSFEVSHRFTQRLCGPFTITFGYVVVVFNCGSVASLGSTIRKPLLYARVSQTEPGLGLRESLEGTHTGALWQQTRVCMSHEWAITTGFDNVKRVKIL
jgi:hypothetical protein